MHAFVEMEVGTERNDEGGCGRSLYTDEKHVT